MLTQRIMNSFCSFITGALILMIACLFSGQALGAGILTATHSADQPIQIKDHHVQITINNGFAMTEVTQIFYNPNARDLEAIYSFPLPQSASLSEVTLYIGEEEINGEVIAKQEARAIYEEEKSKGNETGLAEKNEFYSFDFAVYPVRAQQEIQIRFLYYQPITIDTGVGRYCYPLQEGGTDEAALNFWNNNAKVENTFSVDLELKSAWPVTQVRVPGFQSATTNQINEGHYKVSISEQQVELTKDFVFYYRLAENLPGRVELIPYRADKNKPGHFMMVVTPGMDLKPLNQGADYLFVLDVSGSMDSKIFSLTSGVARALGEMRDHDRFRIITFNNSAHDLTRGWISATQENVQHYNTVVGRLSTGGGTNLYSGLSLALKSLDNDRATSIVLVTDGVTNTGVVEPAMFKKLMKKYDVRVFGFLMGNSANWPLMRVIAETSGGFYAPVSNCDDIVGQIMLAKSKIVYECLHSATLKFSGIKVFDATDEHLGKVYRGEQLVFFGRYEKGGRAKIKLEGTMTGEDKTYKTEFDFPEICTDHPEIERLWALDRIERLELLADMGEMPEGESKEAVRDLGIEYQLVTDETSMLVLADSSFEERGIERRNQQRVAVEELARATRAQQAQSNNTLARPKRADESQPMFPNSAPSPGRSGGGALDPTTVAMAFGALLLAGCAINRPKGPKKENS